jgi:hypothetical protein
MTNGGDHRTGHGVTSARTPAAATRGCGTTTASQARCRMGVVHVARENKDPVLHASSGLRPVCPFTTWCSAPKLNRPSRTTRRRVASRGTSPFPELPSPSTRRRVNTATGPEHRRTANSTTRGVGRSNHWTSSTATNTVCEPANPSSSDSEVGDIVVG